MDEIFSRRSGQSRVAEGGKEAGRTGLWVCTRAVGESMPCRLRSPFSLSVRCLFRELPPGKMCGAGKNGADDVPAVGELEVETARRAAAARSPDRPAMIPGASGEARRASARWFCADELPYERGWYGPARRW